MIDGTLTVREARRRWFLASGYGAEGNYDEAWIWIALGPLKLPVRNLPSRRYAVRYHDLHHVVTGYPTDLRSELLISAWELGAGCRDAAFAWFINLAGMMAGLLTMPGEMARAFFQGRRARSLYGQDIDALLDLPLSRLRAQVGVPAPPPAPTAADWLALGLTVPGAVLVGALHLLPLLAPMALLLGVLR